MRRQKWRQLTRLAETESRPQRQQHTWVQPSEVAEPSSSVEPFRLARPCRELQQVRTPPLQPFRAECSRVESLRMVA